ncbi:MAG: tetratricopeptide repeat protein [Planctomycetaceae bacterium]
MKSQIKWCLAIILVFSVPVSEALGQTAEIQKLMGQFEQLHQQKRFGELEGVAAKLVELSRKAFGPSHTDTAVCLENLAMVKAELGKHKEAVGLYQDAVRIHDARKAAQPGDAIPALQGLGSSLVALGLETQAIDVYERIVSERRKSGDLENPAIALNLTHLGQCQRRMRLFEQAEISFRNALKIIEAKFGPTHPHTASCLENLGSLLGEDQKFGEAKEVYVRALEIRKQTSGPSSLPTAISTSGYGVVQLKAGKYADAVVSFQAAVAIVEQLLPADDPQLAVCLDNLGSALTETGNYEAAKVTLQRALTIRESKLGPKHADTVTTLNNLGRVYDNLADRAAAEMLYRRALDAERSFAVLNNLGSLSLRQEKFDTCISLLTEAVAASERSGAVSELDRASCFANLGTAYRQIGDLAQALACLDRALEIRRKVLSEDHPTTASSLNALASLRKDLGDLKTAQDLAYRAWKIADRKLGAGHRDTLTFLVNLASIHDDMDQPDAETLYRSALEAAETAAEPDEEMIGVICGNLGQVLSGTGKQHEAEGLLLRSLEIGRKLNLKAQQLASLNNLAMLYRKQGHADKAEEYLLEGLQLSEKLFGALHPDTMTLAINRAMLQLESRHRDAAFASFDGIIRRLQKFTESVLPSLTSQQQQTFLNHHIRTSLDAGLTLSCEDSSRDTTGFEWVLNTKGAGHAASVRRSSQHGKVQNAADTVNHSMSEWATAKMVGEQLPASSALIEIAHFETLNFEVPGQSIHQQQYRYRAWIVSGAESAVPIAVDLGEASAIDDTIARVRAQIQNSGSSNSPDDQQAVDAVNRDMNRLRELVWDPLSPHLQGIDEIVLSPDGALWLAPWAALPINDDRFLIEDYSLRYAISGRDLLAVRKGQPTTAPAILANPEFDQEAAEKRASIEAMFRNIPVADETTTRSFSAKTLLPQAVPLPNTAIEALAIQPKLAAYTGQNVTLYKDRYALERVAKALRSPKVVAFATHGFFLPAQSAEASDGFLSTLTKSEGSSHLDSEGKVIENPFLRCGLLLAGCNHRDTAVGDDDGILTGLEIVGIDLRGTELVVLSACETGIGDVRNGEGVAGLRQAFQLAGAEAVVSTLWQVPDRDSALLMSKFFEELAAGKSKAVALRNAQLERIEKRRERFGAAHPFYWAAFTLTGN